MKNGGDGLNSHPRSHINEKLETTIIRGNETNYNYDFSERLNKSLQFKERTIKEDSVRYKLELPFNQLDKS